MHPHSPIEHKLTIKQPAVRRPRKAASGPARPNWHLTRLSDEGLARCQTVISGVLALAEMFQKSNAGNSGKLPATRVLLSRAERETLLAHANPTKPLKDRLDLPSDRPRMVELTLVETLKLTLALEPAIAASRSRQAAGLKALMRKLDVGLDRLLGEDPRSRRPAGGGQSRRASSPTHARRFTPRWFTTKTAKAASPSVVWG